jgi:hypothetical protein
LLITGDFGIIASGVGISVGGIVDARLLPNAPLQNWVRTDGNIATIPANARADVIAVGVVSLPDITTGVRLPSPQGDLAVGVRVRNLRLYYTHYFADQAELQAGQNATTRRRTGYRRPRLPRIQRDGRRPRLPVATDGR